MSKPIDLVVLSVKPRAAWCRLPESGRVLSLRANRLWDVVPGAIVTISPQKFWRFAGHPYLSGEILSTKVDGLALDLVPLQLQDMGT